MVRSEQSNATNLNGTKTAEEGEFEWSSSVQSMILGSFYAWYVISQVSAFIFFIKVNSFPFRYFMGNL